MMVSRDGSVEACYAEDRSVFWRSRSPLPTGLSASIVEHDGELRVTVFTGATSAKRYVPSGSNAPVQVQARVKLGDGAPLVERLSAQFEFGPRGEAPPDNTLDVVSAEVLQFVGYLTAFSSTFVEHWDLEREKLAAGAAAAAGAVGVSVGSEVESAVREVFASHGLSAPADLDRDGAISSLVERVGFAAPVSQVPPGAELVSAARDALRASAGERFGSGGRLSEAEMVTYVADRLLSEMELSEVEAFDAAEVAYAAFHSVYFSSGLFPDRGAVEVA